MDRRYYYKDLVPFVVLVANECIITGVNTLFKAATLQGMSKYVFVTYSYAFATIFFFPGYLYHTRFSIIPSTCLLQIICIYIYIYIYTLTVLMIVFHVLLRSRVVPQLSFSILSKIAILGVIG
jgi:hypothetical protein